MSIIDSTEGFFRNAHAVQVFDKGVVGNIGKFADVGKGGVGAVAVDESVAVLDFDHLREVGDEIVVIVTSGAVEQFFHMVNTSLKNYFVV